MFDLSRTGGTATAVFSLQAFGVSDPFRSGQPTLWSASGLKAASNGMVGADGCARSLFFWRGDARSPQPGVRPCCRHHLCLPSVSGEPLHHPMGTSHYTRIWGLSIPYHYILYINV